MPSTVGSFGLFDTDRQGFTQDVDNMVGLEMYFKMVLNITSPNVTVLELDQLLQQTNIPGSVSVKSNVALNGRGLIQITTPDITTNANNGKNGKSVFEDSASIIKFRKLIMSTTIINANIQGSI